MASFLIRYSLCVNEEKKCLSHIYWLPKLHKNILTELKYHHVLAPEFKILFIRYTKLHQ